MANKPRMKMPVADRAKQFMPFAALKGLPEALREKERIVLARRELTEEMVDELNAKLQRIERGKLITVEYFSGGEYLQLTGMVARLDETQRILQVVDTRIPIGDIADIRLLDEAGGAEGGNG